MNSSNSSDIITFGSVPQIILLIEAIFGLISSTSCFIFIQFFLKLNPFLKGTLKTLSIIQFIGFVAAIIGHVMAAFEDQGTMLTCTLMISTLSQTGAFSFNITMIISILRYYMAWKASKAEIAKPSHLIAFIVLCIGLHTLISGFFNAVWIVFKIKSLPMTCAGIEPELDVPGLQAIRGAYFLVQAGISVYFDRKLVEFVKNRQAQESNDVNLVPWKSSDEDENDLTVPVRATFLSTITFFAVILFAIFLIVIYQHYYNQIFYLFVIITSFPIISLPLVLIFTIKHHKDEQAQKKVHQPPEGLQFHEEVPRCNGLQFHDDEVFTLQVESYDTVQMNVLSTRPVNLPLDDVTVEQLPGIVLQ